MYFAELYIPSGKYKIMRNLLLMLVCAGIFSFVNAQNITDPEKITDSLYIHEIEDRLEPDKVLHAEPLFIDLIRDLGARKGEREWNAGMGLTDNTRYDKYTALIEYEWAPVNRLGLEIELPFSFYYPIQGHKSAPGNKLNGLKLAAQYSFLVSEKMKTSLAAGYIHEFEMAEFSKYKSSGIYKGNLYNPFLITAKRWGNNFHSLLYTGPVIETRLNTPGQLTTWQINSNFHYMISGTRNFIGIEFNKEVYNQNFSMTVRPQMRLGIAENLLVGIVTGVPVSRDTERFSTFLRLIYEPGHRKKTV